MRMTSIRSNVMKHFVKSWNREATMQAMDTKTAKRSEGKRTKLAFLAALATAGLTLGLSGCGIGPLATTVTEPVSPTGAFAVSGTVFGGSQPIGGATVYLYAVNQGGYGGASALVTQTTSSSTAGSTYGTFTLAGSASLCSPANAMVYVVSVGGNSGAGTNANTALMSLLGPCNTAAANYPRFKINESTTVAAVWALAGFMSDYQHVAVSATNAAGLTEAFANAAQLVDITTGNSPGLNLPTGTIIPQKTIYTLSDILAACVNTNGTGGSSNNCGTLFTNSTTTSTPANTIKAALNIAQSPGLTTTKLANLYSLVPATSPPYQPTLAATPSDFTLAVVYAPSTLNSPSALAADAAGNIWITNSTGNSVTVLSNAGVVNSGITGSTSSLNAPSAIAIDASGNAWVANKGSSSVSEILSTGGNGTNSPYTTNFSSPTGIAIDNLANVWVSNGGNTSITKIASGTTTNYTPAGVSAPVAIAVNPH